MESMESDDARHPLANTDVNEIVRLTQALTELTRVIERMRRPRYFEMVERPSRFLFYNFLGGVLRGVGGAVGATLVMAMLFYLLGQLQWVPVIGRWIAEILKIVEAYR